MSIVHPATVIVCGGTGSGKTIITRSILEHHDSVLIGAPRVPKVVWCYGIEQPVFRKPVRNVRLLYNEGLIDEEFVRSARPDIVVVDDMMTEKSDDRFMHNLFVKISHHLNVTVVFITQNLYAKGQVNLKRNAHYLLMMRNPSDKSQIATLGRQLFPRRKALLDHFYESYDDATKDKFGYLLIDVSPSSDERQKLKTNILPDRSGRLAVTVYQPK